jgi:REP element-mobilizing transposase RayT
VFLEPDGSDLDQVGIEEGFCIEGVPMPYWRLFYHFVWGVKNREPLIKSEWEESLQNVMVAKAMELDALVHAIGGVDDHVHLVGSVPPKIALSKFIGQVKGNSAHWVNHELKLGYHFAWQAEYGAISFGGRQLQMVVRYVKNQRQHHTEGTTIPGLERAVPAQN